MSYKLRSVHEIAATMRAFTDEEALINFTAGVLLGKNRRGTVINTDEEDELRGELYLILRVAGERLMLLAPTKGVGNGQVESEVSRPGDA